MWVKHFTVSFSETKHGRPSSSLKIAAPFYIFSICASNHAKFFLENNSFLLLKVSRINNVFESLFIILLFFLASVISTKNSLRTNLILCQRCISQTNLLFPKRAFSFHFKMPPICPFYAVEQ